MKCISCGTDNNLKDRTANMGRCKSCNHPFAFEPTAMPAATKLTDPFFAKLIADLSANQTLFFTPRQLYYLLEQRLRSKASRNNIVSNPVAGIGCNLFAIVLLGIIIQNIFRISLNLLIPIVLGLVLTFNIWINTENAVSALVNRRTRQQSIKILKIMAGVILLVGLPASIIAKTPLGTITSIGLGISSIWLSWDCQRKQSNIFDQFLVDRTQFDTWLNQWNRINNSPAKILPPPQTNSIPAAPNPEVTAYSFDRVVVCDRPEIAQLLISNNFHFENNCAILTIDGYPQHIFTTTMEMLRRNPDLKVYALHDCSPAGTELVHRLRTEESWFPDPTVPIVDVGILPRQIMNNLDVMTPQSAGSIQAAQGLTPDLRASLNFDELGWLETGYYLELESFSSQKIIQILQRAINESRELAVIEDGDGLMNYSSIGFYTVDSFG
ncbi:MAG: hypothetical protein LH474_00655 [Chamaesiphon sp.]|nr:hypothetical protein [Chamaesiphon sp.]